MYKGEIDIISSYSTNDPNYKPKRGTKIFVHQQNSDIHAGLRMVGFEVLRPSGNTDLIQEVMNVSKNGRKNGIKAYVIDSLAVDNGEMQAPFSLIGYIRVYDPYTPILALSYDTNPESVRAAFRYGATAYLPRPQHLDMIVAILEGLIANDTVANEAMQLLEQSTKAKVDLTGKNAKAAEREQRKSYGREMIRLSDYMFLDYGGKRLAFIDRDGIFTFSEVLNDSIVSVLHCLATHKGQRMSAIAIGRLLGEVFTGQDWRDEKRVVLNISNHIKRISYLLEKYDKYKTLRITSKQKYGTTLEVLPADEDAVKVYEREKLNKKTEKGSVKAGFNLVNLMEKNKTVKKIEVKEDKPDTQDTDALLEELL